MPEKARCKVKPLSTRMLCHYQIAPSPVIWFIENDEISIGPVSDFSPVTEKKIVTELTVHYMWLMRICETEKALTRQKIWSPVAESQSLHNEIILVEPQVIMGRPRLCCQSPKDPKRIIRLSILGKDLLLLHALENEYKKKLESQTP